MTRPDHIYVSIINASAGNVWNAITDADMTEQYFYGTRVASTWEPGAEVIYEYADGRRASEGKILSIEAGSHVEMTFLPLWDPELTAEGAVREVWTIESMGAVTKLTVETYDIVSGGAIDRDFADGLPFIISGMKTLLETGSPLPA